MKPHHIKTAPPNKKITFWQLTLLAISLCFTPPGQAASFPPPPPTPLTGVKQLWNGGTSNHSCALTASSGVKCWGANYYGQLGDNSTINQWTPIDVTGLTNGVVAITLGGRHSCALTASGSVKCWGTNDFGQLGDNSTIEKWTPVNVTGLTNGVAAITLGIFHSCALTDSGGVKCWGNNDYGQLGDNSTINQWTPVDVTGLTNSVAAIALGAYHSCALTTSGGVKCWGYNDYGQLGDNSFIYKWTPVDVTGLTNDVATIALGTFHTCALTTSGGVKCWGLNYDGQLGDNSTTNRGTPVDVTGLTNGVATIALGAYHSCALTVSGGVKCWGNNDYGQLGDNSTINQWTPVDVTGLTNGVAAIAFGAYHSCALTASGGVKCWGYNDFGQLGDNSTTQRGTPVDVLIFPDLEVQGNDIPIPSGHTTPSLLEGTDFGQVRIDTQGSRSFTLHNSGGGPLSFFGSSSDIACSSGITPSSNFMDVSIDPLNPYSFSISLTPHMISSGTCTVTLSNNDPDPTENPYTFTLAIQGVDKPTLMATLPTLTRLYGTPNPVLLPASYSGWVNSVEPLDVRPTLTTTATQTSPPGDYPITCSEGGQDDNYLIVCGPPGTLTITSANTTTTLTPPTPNPSLSGSEVTFKFAVKPVSPATEIPTGEVKVLQGTTPICQASLTNGLGTCTAPLNGIGSQTLTAIYLGNEAFQESTSEAISHFLLQAGYVSTPVSGEALNFGSTPLNTPLTAFLKIKETGNQTLQVTLQNLTGDPDFKILTPFPISMANGDPEFSIVLTCTPIAPGSHMATLELSTNDPAQPTVSYPLTCEGQATPGYESSPPINNILEIGNSQVGQSITFPLSVKEIGTGDLQVNFVELTGTHINDFKVISPTFPFTIKDEAGTVQTIEIRCTPSDQGKREARLTLTSNDPQHSTLTYPLECQGTAIPTAGYASLPDHNKAINVGTSRLGQPISFTLELMETGNFPLTVVFKGISGPQAQDFSILSPPFPLTLPDGTSPQAVILRCVPSALGLRMAELAFTSNDPQHPLITYTLQCIGQEEVVYHSEPPPNSSINFERLLLGKTQIMSLSVNKIGKGTLDIVKGELTGSSYFSLLNWKLPFSLQDTVQSFPIQCLPWEPGKHQATLVVTLSDLSKISYSLLCYGLSGSTEITKINLSNQIIAAHTRPEEVIGSFHSEATGIAEPHFLYRLIEDAQGTFKVLENQLILAKPLAFEQAVIYQIIVKSMEENSGVEKNASFVIKVNAENHAPTEIQLSHAVVGERSQGLVGTLTTLDPDVMDTHTYGLSSGGQFVLENGNEVHVAPGIVFKKQSSYLIRIASTDAGGLSVTQEFPIEIQAEARFSGEIRDEAGEIRKNGKIDEPERVTLIGRIQPSAFHVGQLADLVFFYHWTPFNGGKVLEGSSVFAPQTRLEEKMAEMKFFQGKLGGLAGVFKIELGYRVGEEEWSEPVLVLQVLPNRPPTKLELEMKPILEKSLENTLIGTLSMEDPDQSEHFHYKLVDENKWRGYLIIKGNQLLTGPWFLRWGQSYAVTIQGMDSSGASIERTFELEVLKDDSMGELRLTHAQVFEGSAAGMPIGRLFILGEKEENGYRLLENAQGRFALKGDILVVKAGEKLDFEVQSHHEIVVEVMRGSQRREKAFSIEVLDVPD